MEVEVGKAILGGAVRHELQDHAFGDTEVYWVLGKKEIACGYFGNGQAEVSIFQPGQDALVFKDDDARALRDCGADVCVQRNDSTGPDTFVEGQTMPGLTLEGVREELTS